MKARLPKQTNKALTIVEVLVVIVVLALLAAMLIPKLAANKLHSSRTGCVINLKGINLAFLIWEGDNNNQYPMSYSTNGILAWPATTNIAVYFQAMSNQLNSPKFLICPADRRHVPATNWTTDFNNSHISYFLNLDASEAYPQEIMSGDDNLAINGAPVKSGLLLLPANAAISWTTERHGRVGNLSFADGSVAAESSSGLQNALELSLQGTPIITNRIAIP
jgi:prepilin-type processing-associated H-X9-DG protein